MAAKTRGGAAPYRKGAQFERECQKYLEERDFLVVRQPKSQSPFDLLASRGTFRVLIQCKTNGKLPKKERQALEELCFAHDYSPILAWKEGKEIRFRYLYGKEELFTP